MFFTHTSKQPTLSNFEWDFMTFVQEDEGPAEAPPGAEEEEEEEEEEDEEEEEEEE